MCTMPTWTIRFSFFLKVFFFVFFAAAFAIRFSTSLSSYWQPCPCAVPCGYGHWCGFVDPASAVRDDAAVPDRSPFRCDAGCSATPLSEDRLRLRLRLQGWYGDC